MPVIVPSTYECLIPRSQKAYEIASQLIQVWNTALVYFERGITNSDGLALQQFQPKKQ